MLDLYGAREANKNHKIDNGALIRSEHNVADAMTNVFGNEALLKVLRSHRQCNHPVVNMWLHPRSWAIPKVFYRDIHCCEGRHD
jgi:hypothetical protein